MNTFPGIMSIEYNQLKQKILEYIKEHDYFWLSNLRIDIIPTKYCLEKLK